MTFRREHLTASLAVIASLVVLLGGAQPAAALHDAGLGCSACHALGGSGTPGDNETYHSDTSYIRNGSRTLGTMINYGFVPDPVSVEDFACTYCHSSQAENVTMQEVLDHFTTPAYKHPVGADYTTFPWTNNNNEYLSGALSSNISGALQCTGCHDPAIITVPSHALPVGAGGTWDQAVNPYALRDGNPATLQDVANPAFSESEVNEFCTNLCHNAGLSTVINSQRGGHGADTADATVRGISVDNPRAGKAGCEACHAEHYTDQDMLIPSAVAGEDECERCHKTDNYYGGAAVGGDLTDYYTGGHGKQEAQNSGGTIQYLCTQCHTTSISHDFANENRIPWNEAVDQCGACHDGIAKNHIPTAGYPGAPTLYCLDCHDQHGDGTGANMWMVKETITTPDDGLDKTPVYLTAVTGFNDSFDDGQADDYSICSVCHVNTTHNTRTPTGNLHEDSSLKEGTNCTTSDCHTHDNNFVEDCTRCHGYPPPPPMFAADEGAHTTHDSSPYTYTCVKCHTGYVHKNAVSDVGFDAQNPTGSWDGTNCNNTNCHNPYLVTVETTPTTNNPTWYETNAVGCVFCHAGKTSGSHQAHLDQGYACTVCHETWATTAGHANSVAENSGMVDFVTSVGSVNLTGATFSDADTGGDNSCTNVYCHGENWTGGGGTDTTPVWGDSTTAECGDCHSVTPASDAHPTHLTALFGPGAQCYNCHGGTTSNSPAVVDHPTHVSGGIDVNGSSLAATTMCDTCHNGSVATARNEWIQPAGHWRTVTGNYCQHCHDATASTVNTPATAPTGDVTANNKTLYYTSGGHGHTGTYNATLHGQSGPAYACTVCHDPTVAHIDATPGNTDRLNAVADDGLPYTDVLSEVCLDCHQVGGGGSLGDASAEVTVHSGGVTDRYNINTPPLQAFPAYGESGNYGTNPGYQCGACHDPHGTNKLAMILPAIDGNLGAGAVPIAGFDSTDGDLQDLDFSSAADNGVCDVCHDGLGGDSHPDTYRPNNHEQGGVGDSCAACHSHADSFSVDCANCHGSPPPTSPAAGTTVDWSAADVAAGTIGDHGTHASGATPYISGDCFTTCHVKDTHLQDKTTANMGDQPGTTGVFQYGTWSDGATAGNVSVIDDSCVNVSCHNSDYGAPANQFMSAANPGYTRYWNQDLDCYACHAYDGSDSALRPGVESDDLMSTGSHTGHLADAASTLSDGTPIITCTDCHADNSGNNAHKNAAVSLDYVSVPDYYAVTELYDQDGAAPWTPWSPVPTDGSRAYGFCNNVYCHSTVQPNNPPAGAPVYKPIQWGGATVCGSCHDDDPDHSFMGTGVHMSSGSHTKHIDRDDPSNGIYDYLCNTCHEAAAGSCLECHNHSNGTIDLPLEWTVGAITLAGVYDTNGDTGSDEAAGTPGSAYGRCTGVYCHSDGREAKTGLVGALPYDYDTLTWGGANPGCEGCHGGSVPDVAGTYEFGAPDYANSGAVNKEANSHAAHVGNGIACAECHNTTLTDSDPAGGWLLTAGGPHVDGAVNVVLSPTVDNNGATANYDAGLKQCSGTTCHGGGAPVWGATLTNGCFDCHTGAEVNNRPASQADSTPNALSMAQYNGQGHGLIGQYSPGSGNDGAGFTWDSGVNSGCYECHASGADHFLTTNSLDPYRLGGYATTVDALCDSCHGPGATGSSTIIDIEQHAAAMFAGTTKNWPGTPDYDYKCVDCHDPHGDANWYMVKEYVSAPTTALDALFGSDGYGSPQDPVGPVTFTDVTGKAADSYAENLTDGICEVCHNQTAYYNRGDAGSQDHYATTQCTMCHLHSEGFKGSCTACHGDPATGEVWPDGDNLNNPASGSYSDTDEGSHDKHIALLVAKEGFDPTDLQDQIAMCDYCHPDPGGNNHDADGGADQQADVDTAGMLKIDGVNDGAGAADGNLVAGYNTTTNVCANVDCHYENPTPTYAGGGWNDGENVAYDADCATCHATVASYADGDLPNAHNAHAGDLNYACTQCHPDNSADIQHLDDGVDLLFTGALGEPGGTQGSQAGSDLAVKYGVLVGTYATCSNFYCHGDDTSGTVQLSDGLLTQPTWNQPNDGNCGNCHANFGAPADSGGDALNIAEGIDYVPMITGSHAVHFRQYTVGGGGAFLASRGPQFDPHSGSLTQGGCGKCHNINGAGSSCANCHTVGAGANIPTGSHVDGNVDFQNQLITVAPLVPPYDTYTPVTLAATPACGNCHVSGTADAKNLVNWNNASYRLACLGCHDSVDPANSRHNDVGVNAPDKNLYWSADDGGHGHTGAYTGTGNTGPGYDCSTCHDDESEHISHALGEDRLAGGLTRLNTCADCHNVEAVPANGTLGYDATVEASDHSTTVTGNYAYDYSCVICHDPHGTSNIAMVNTTIVDGMGADALGVTLAAETGLDPSNVQDNGVCDRCHTDGGLSHANIPGYANNHNWGDTCLKCHHHTESFSGTCTDCHGNDLASPKTIWPDGVDNNPARSPYADSDLGSHEKHIALLVAKEGFDLNVIDDQIAMCDYCHPTVGANHDADGGLDQQVDVDAAGMLKIDGTSDGAGTADGHNAATYNTGTKVCANADCHYETATPGYLGAGWDGGDTGGNDVTCASCHADTAGYANGDLPNAHNAHVASNSAGTPRGKEYACTQCHPDNGANMQHLDDAVELDFTATSFEPGAVQGAAAGSDGQVKYGAAGGYATCGNFYCHGADLGNGGTDLTPQWDVIASGNCGACHGIQGSESSDVDRSAPGWAVASNDHLVHFTDARGPSFPDSHMSSSCWQCHNSVDPSFHASNCVDCHYPGGAATSPYGPGATNPTPTHVNGTVEFGNTDQSSFEYSTLGAAVGPPAADNTDRCDNCHSTALVGGNRGSALAKAYWPTADVIPCLNCHNGTDRAHSTADGTSGVDAPDKDLYYASTGHGNSGSYNATLHGQNGPGYGCGNCHDEASAHISGSLNDSDRLDAVAGDALTYTTATSEFCLNCHDGAGGGAAVTEVTVHSGGVTGRYNTNIPPLDAFPAYGDSGNYAANPGYQCDACHDPHGTTKLAMILPAIDGNLGGVPNSIPVAGFQSSDADLYDLDPSSGYNDGVCDVCHLGALGDSHPDTGVEVNNHNWGGTGANCMTCHSHAESFVGSCTACHGNDATGEIWPDGLANNPNRDADFDSDLGSHQKHISLLVAKEGFTLSIDDQKAMCAYCHPDPGGSSHDVNTVGSPDPQADVIGDGYTAGLFKKIDGSSDGAGENDVNTAGTYNQGARTCSGVDCHYEVATPVYGGGGWNDGDGAYDADCNSCHTDRDNYTPFTTIPGTASDLPNAHDAHVAPQSLGNNGGKGYDCTQCHPDNGANTQHLDDTVQIAFSATSFEPGDIQGTAAGSDGAVKYGVLAGTYATCSNFFCHGSELNNGGTDQTPTWNIIASGNCGTCHGVFADPVAQGRAAGLAVTSGDHVLHFTADYGPNFPDVHPITDCWQCHPSMTPAAHAASCGDCHPGSSYGAIAQGASNPTPVHVNGTVEFGNTNQTTFEYSTLGAAIGPPAADNTDRCDNCHSTALVGGNRGSALAKAYWTTADVIPCLNCHNATDRAHSTADGVSGVDAPDKNLYYATTGHGNSGSYNATLHGQNGPGYGCGNCHDETTAHISGSLNDSDRLDAVAGDALTYTTATSEFCLNCHDGAGAGAAVTEVSVHSGGVTGNYDSLGEAFNAYPAYGDSGNYAANPGYQCDQCHDPHGTTKLAMILPTINAGFGAGPASVAGFQSSDGDLLDLDPSATNDPPDGVCDVCHLSGGNSHPDTGQPNNHNQGGTGANCMTCHTHAQSFVGSCTACHGNDQASPKTIWPDGLANNPARSPYADSDLGSHEKHIALLVAKEGFDLNVIDDQIAMCDYCHPDPGGANHDANGGSDSQADVDAAAMLKIDGTSDGAGTADGNLAAGYNTGTKVCSNADCHYETPTPAYAGAGWDGGDAGGNDVTCASCHATLASYVAGDLPNSHDAHVDGKSYACTSCHADNSGDYQHLDDDVDLNLSAALGEPGGVAPATSVNQQAVKYGGGGTYPTCQNLFCHGDDTVEGDTWSVSGGALTDPRWNVPADGDCGTCHDGNGSDGDASTMASGSHNTHYNAVYGAGLATPAACVICHTGYALADASHVNATRNLVTEQVTPNLTPTNLAGTAVCNRCHGITLYDSEIVKAEWASESVGNYTDVTCESCHGGGDAAATENADGSGATAPANGSATFTSVGHGLGAVSTYSPSGRDGAEAACVDCHNEASSHIDAGTTADRLDTAGNNLCNGCHDGAGAGSATTQVSSHANTSGTMGASVNYTAQRAAFELNCVECHDVHGTSNIYMINATDPDGPLVATRIYNDVIGDYLTFLYNGTVDFDDDTVGTSSTAGIGFADTSGLGNATKICQTCHTTTGEYQFDGGSGTHATSLCSGCHPHDVDDDFTGGSQDGFMPKGDCEDCHGGQEPYVSQGAPDVSTYWDGSWWDTTRGGDDATQQGGHGDADGRESGDPALAPGCTDCHDIGQPQPNTHYDGIYDSIWNNTTRNTNTAHLKTFFIDQGPVSNWDTQVTFDNACYGQCHSSKGVADMRHQKDNNPAVNAVLLGTHLTYANGDTLSQPWPIDLDLSTDAPGLSEYYAPCVACHDPHGTPTNDYRGGPDTGTNYMLRDQWISTSALCQVCHR